MRVGAPRAGIFYATGTQETVAAAELVREGLARGGGLTVEEPEPIGGTSMRDLGAFDFLALGCPSYLWEANRVSALEWDTVEPPFDDPLDLVGTKVAVFGCGRQLEYPDNFVDGLGVVWEQMQARGAELVGRTSSELFVGAYEFNYSRAAEPRRGGSAGGKFCGLALDNGTQAELTEERVAVWCAQLRRELGLDKD